MTRRAYKQRKPRQRFRLIREATSELKKVVWLSRREVVYLTSLVLIVAIIIGLILGLIDYGFTRLISDFLLGGS